MVRPGKLAAYGQRASRTRFRISLGRVPPWVRATNGTIFGGKFHKSLGEEYTWSRWMKDGVCACEVAGIPMRGYCRFTLVRRVVTGAQGGPFPSSSFSLLLFHAFSVTSRGSCSAFLAHRRTRRRSGSEQSSERIKSRRFPGRTCSTSLRSLHEFPHAINESAESCDFHPSQEELPSFAFNILFSYPYPRSLLLETSPKFPYDFQWRDKKIFPSRSSSS